MSNNTDNFQWSDELVKELVDALPLYDKETYHQIAKQFKESKVKKEQPKQEWEILSLKEKRHDIEVKLTDGKSANGYTTDNYLNDPCNSVKDGSYKIHSVKRHDGEVYSVGSITNKGEINHFTIAGDEMVASFKNNGGFCNINFLSQKINPPEEEPIKVQRFVPGIAFREDNNYVYGLSVSQVIPEEKYEPIKGAIQKILNNEGKCVVNKEAIDKQIIMGQALEIVRLCNELESKKYTENELIEERSKAFYASRETDPTQTTIPLKYPTAAHYIESLKVKK